MRHSESRNNSTPGMRNGWRIWHTLSPEKCCPLAQFLKVDRRLRTSILMNNSSSQIAAPFQVFEVLSLSVRVPIH